MTLEFLWFTLPDLFICSGSKNPVEKKRFKKKTPTKSKKLGSESIVCQNSPG